MKRTLSFACLILTLVLACVLLSACLMFAGQTDTKDKKLDAPTDIVIEDVTKESIFIFDVIYGEEGGGATEISIDGAVWIDFDNLKGCEMGGLTPNTEYTIYARQKGYGEYPASEAFTKKVTTLRDTTKLVPENVTATIYHGVVTLNGVTDEMEVSYDNGVTYTADKTHSYDQKGEKTILVRYKENANYLAGYDLQIKVKYNDFAGGSGTEADPYLIENFQEFMAIKDNSYSAVYKLLEDIRFPETPVTEIINFMGTLLGNNKKLIAPRFDYTENGNINAYGGIFHTNGRDTKICDLIVENAEISTYASQTIHGLLINDAKEISNCNVSGKIIVAFTDSRTYLVGGLCGQISQAGSTVTNCHVDVTVETTGIDQLTGISLGGLVGKISDNCTIESNSAKLTALLGEIKFYDGYAGGLVGSVEKATAVSISKSWAETNLSLTAINCYSGGLVATSLNTDITNCYATGEIVASGRNISRISKCVSGGITAGVEADSSKTTGSITNCYSAVNFTLDKNESDIVAAGIICNAIGSSDKKIENCLFTGTITVSESYANNTVIVDAIVFNASGYTVANNYIAVSSAQGIEVDNNISTVSVELYLTANWFRQTLNFDETVWMLANGKLPELK